MKKFIFVFAIAIVWNLAYAEELKECKNENDKISGCVRKVYYENGHLEIPYKNGKVEGIAKAYFENGNLQSETPYKNGKLEGIGKLYYENGNLKFEVPYKNDKGEGIGKAYFENGDVAFSIIGEGGNIISGKCANGKVVNADEINGLEYTFKDSDIKKICGD